MNILTKAKKNIAVLCPYKKLGKALQINDAIMLEAGRMCYLHSNRYFYRGCSPVSKFFTGFLAYTRPSFSLRKQPDEELVDPNLTSIEKIENLLSFWLDEFLDEKCTHGRVSRQNTTPIEFLAEFCRETRSCVRGLRGKLFSPAKQHTSIINRN